jgi:molybdopterin synthase sulfur carrier subunit
MSITVSLPTILRPLADNQRRVETTGTQLGAVIDNLEIAYPGLKARLVEDGALRRYINIYINDEDVRFLDGLESELNDGDRIDVLPAVAGG